MDGERELKTSASAGFRAFLDGDYSGCVAELAPLLKYFATDDMILLVLISLQRAGTRKQLLEFADQSLRAAASSLETQRIIQLVLGMPTTQLENVENDITRNAKESYYRSAHATSTGRVEDAIRLLNDCVAAPGDFLEKHMAEAELCRIFRPQLDEKTWAHAFSKEAERAFQARDFGAATQASAHALDLLKQRADIVPAALEPVLQSLANFFHQLGYDEQACYVLERLLDVMRIQGASDELTLTLTNLAVTYQNLGRLGNAEALFREALASIEVCRLEGCARHVEILNLLGFLLAGEHRFAEAESFYRAARKILEVGSGLDRSDYGETLKNLGNLYLAMDRVEDALSVLQDALASRKRVGSCSDIAVSIIDLSSAYMHHGNFVAAEPLCREAVSFCLSHLGEPHQDTRDSLFNLGILLIRTERVDEGSAFLELAVETTQKHAPDDRRLPLFSASLASSYVSTGKREQARAIYENLVALVRRGEGQIDSQVVSSMLDGAAFFQACGAYSKAEYLYLYAIDHFQPIDGSIRPHLIRSHADLAALYAQLHRYEDCVAHAESALSLMEASGQKGSLDWSKILNTLGEAYRGNGSSDIAISIFEECLNIRLIKAGERSPLVANTLNNLALAHLANERFSFAEDLFRRASAITLSADGPESIEYSNDLHNLGELLVRQGRMPDAISLYEEACRIRRGAQSDRDPIFAALLDDLAFAYITQGRQTDAFGLLERAIVIDSEALGEIFGISAEQNRIDFLRRIEHRYHAFLALAFSVQEIEADDALLYQVVLRRKGLMLEASSMLRKASHSAYRIDLQSPVRDWLGSRYLDRSYIYEQLLSTRAQLAKAALAGGLKDEKQSVPADIDALTETKCDLEAKLARSAPEMELASALQNVSHTDITARIAPGTALIEIVRVGRTAAPITTPWATDEGYVAFVLQADGHQPVLSFELGDAAYLDGLIASFLAEMSKPVATSPIEAEPSGEKLRQAILGKAFKALDGVSTILIAPDGEFCLLPFEALPSETGGVLIDDYQFCYLSCGRDLVNFGTPPISLHSPSIVAADPAFNLVTSTDVRPEPDAVQADNEHVFETGSASRVSNDFDRGMRFGPLKNTAEEGRQIAARLQVTPWLGPMVTERRLKEVQSPLVLHLATHGFFLPNQSMTASGSINGRLLGAAIEDPMLRSGLALSGANIWLAGGKPPPEAEDGLLTAEDVIALNLSGTRLVVLSACKTGLGDVQRGEGVFGLRRAFALAGARALVMSLWNVPDEITKDLMVAFYDRLLEGASVNVALRGAKRAIREIYSHPYYWGAFICQGDGDASIFPVFY